MSIQIKTIAVTGEKQTEIMNLTTPDLRNGEALIKVHAVALCTLEQRIFRGEVKMPLPCTGGHEVSGEIVALGDGVNKKMWAPGDRVAVTTAASAITAVPDMLISAKGRRKSPYARDCL